MTDSKHHTASTSTQEASLESGKIPVHLAEEVRRLSHDLSNALEVIMQTSYLLGMADAGTSEESKKWRDMLDQGVVQATQINGKLRDYIRAHS